MPVTRTWLNGRVPERHSGGAGSTPAVRTNLLAWEADLVTAPRRKRGEVGSKPTPGTNDGTIAQLGEPPPCKREMRVRVPLAPPSFCECPAHTYRLLSP